MLKGWIKADGNLDGNANNNPKNASVVLSAIEIPESAYKASGKITRDKGADGGTWEAEVTNDGDWIHGTFNNLTGATPDADGEVTRHYGAFGTVLAR